MESTYFDGNKQQKAVYHPIEKRCIAEFFSYGVKIAEYNISGEIKLSPVWDASKITKKYTQKFLDLAAEEIHNRLRSGEIKELVFKYEREKNV
jgi:hypothetical protein